MGGVECGGVSAITCAPSPRGEMREGVRRKGGDVRENRGERL